MARMRKGQRGHEEATKRWHESMLKKFGSEEALHKHMQGMGRKGGMNGSHGGFAADPALAKIAGKKGGRAHAARGKDSDYGYEAIWAEHGAEIMAKYESRTHSAQQLADEYGISASSLRYRMRRDA